MDAAVEIAIRQNLEYDKETGKLIWKSSRRRKLTGKEAGSPNRDGYILVRVAGVSTRAHRVAWFLYYGKWPENDIDHIDGNPSNNEISNLRDVPHRINLMNMRRHRDGKLVGIKFRKKNTVNPWEAMIRLQGKQICIGSFPTQIDAHEAYIKVALNEGKGTYKP